MERERLACLGVVCSRGMEALRSVAVRFSPGSGGFLSFTVAGFSFQEREIFSTLPSPALVPESGGSKSSNLSVLNPGSFWVFVYCFEVFKGETWILSSWFCFGYSGGDLGR